MDSRKPQGRNGSIKPVDRLHATGDSKVGRLIQVILVTALVVPFALREVSPELEIYPAVLLPVGAILVNADDTMLTYPSFEVYAVLPDSSERRMEPDAFLGEIPVQNLIPLIKSHFGSAKPKWRTRWRIWFGRDREWTNEEQVQTLQWFRSRAVANGHPDAVFIRVRRYTKALIKATGKTQVLSTEMAYDIPLYP